jgi:hypothetical protein
MFHETIRRPLGPSQGKVVEQGAGSGGGGELSASVIASPAEPGLGSAETAGREQEAIEVPPAPSNASPKAAPGGDALLRASDVDPAAPGTNLAVNEEGTAGGGKILGKTTSKSEDSSNITPEDEAEAVGGTAAPGTNLAVNEEGAAGGRETLGKTTSKSDDSPNKTPEGRG